MYDLLSSQLGLDIPFGSLTLYHFIIRAFLVYFVGIIIVRIQSQFMNVNTPFTFMLNFIMGSVLANAIVGDAPYLLIVGTALFITFLNWVIELLCFYSPFVRKIFKGSADILVQDGEIIWKNMKHNLVSKDELLEAIRNQINTNDLSAVKKAYFESSGKITIVRK